MPWPSVQSWSSNSPDEVLAAMADGPAARTVVEQLGSHSIIPKALKRLRVRAATTALAQRNQQAQKLAERHAAILAEVERRPNVTLEGTRARLPDTHCTEASIDLMHNTLVRLGLALQEVRARSSAKVTKAPSLSRRTGPAIQITARPSSLVASSLPREAPSVTRGHILPILARLPWLEWASTTPLLMVMGRNTRNDASLAGQGAALAGLLAERLACVCSVASLLSDRHSAAAARVSDIAQLSHAVHSTSADRWSFAPGSRRRPADRPP